MRPQLLASVGVLATVVAVVSLASVALAGQAQTATADSWTPPRTPWGDPDLQGDWSFATITPLERPAQFSGREVLTEEEIAALNQGALTRGDEPPPPGDPGAYNAFWFDRGESTGRTALLVDPPDGRIPVLAPFAVDQSAFRADGGSASRARLWYGSAAETTIYDDLR